MKTKKTNATTSKIIKIDVRSIKDRLLQTKEQRNFFFTNVGEEIVNKIVENVEGQRTFLNERVDRNEPNYLKLKQRKGWDERSLIRKDYSIVTRSNYKGSYSYLDEEITIEIKYPAGVRLELAKYWADKLGKNYDDVLPNERTNKAIIDYIYSRIEYYKDKLVNLKSYFFSRKKILEYLKSINPFGWIKTELRRLEK